MTPDSSVAALRISDGALGWRQQIGAVRYDPWYANDITFFGVTDRTISVLRNSDGKAMWKYTTTSPIHWYPSIVNGTVYLWKDDGTLDVLRTSDGTVLWHYVV